MIIKLDSVKNKLYSPNEVAKILNVTRRTIYRWLGEGVIKPETKTKTGRYLFSREEIYKFVYPRGRKKSRKSPTEETSLGKIYPKYERFI